MGAQPTCDMQLQLVKVILATAQVPSMHVNSILCSEGPSYVRSGMEVSTLKTSQPLYSIEMLCGMRCSYDFVLVYGGHCSIGVNSTQRR